jgi:hypothetical protein
MGGQGFLVGDDCPSFPSVETAFRAFFTGTFSMVGTSGSVPSELARIRMLSRARGFTGSRSARHTSMSTLEGRPVLARASNSIHRRSRSESV